MLPNCMKQLLNERYEGRRHLMVFSGRLMVKWQIGSNNCLFPDGGGALCMTNGWFIVAEAILRIGEIILIRNGKF